MLTHDYGNPSSQHQLGQRAKEILDDARATVAASIGAQPSEIYFTSGGTEADNLAILGVSACCQTAGEMVTTTVEHPAVYKPLRYLRRRGWSIQYIPILDAQLHLAKARTMISPQTILASIMLVNNETGTVFPLREIKEIIRRQSTSLLHCDAVQAYGKIPFTVDELGVDLLTISAHKIHGPKGIGALYVREGTVIKRRVYGGDQERGLRSGTEAMPLIAGFAEAVRVTMTRMDTERRHMREIRDYACNRLRQTFRDIIINTPAEAAPHIISFSLPQLDNGLAVKYLSDHDICVSTAAACKSNHAHGPSMLMHFGLPAALADSTLRVSICGDNTKEELDQMIDHLRAFHSQKR